MPTCFGKSYLFSWLCVSFMNVYQSVCDLLSRGWSGGAKLLGKLSVPGRPTNSDNSNTRACCACSRCGWGGLDIFSLFYRFSFLSPPL